MRWRRQDSSFRETKEIHTHVTHAFHARYEKSFLTDDKLLATIRYYDCNKKSDLFLRDFLIRWIYLFPFSICNIREKFIMFLSMRYIMTRSKHQFMKARPWRAFNVVQWQVQRNYNHRCSLVTRRIPNKALTECGSRAITT